MSTTELGPGDVLMGKYRVEKRLGAGAMGVVYAVVHADLRQRFAVKLMKPSAAQGEQRARFVREARAAVKLKTEHVARVFDVGTTEDGAPYIVMEHLDGRDLLDEIRARGPLPFQEAVEYVLQACEALAEAHAAGIVHRDIKPANLFLTTGTGGLPRVKVLDFGVSKVEDEAALTGNTVLGSPLYMSPEHMQHSAGVDARADIWSLAVTLYELVAGKTPFDGDKIEIVCARVFQLPPTPLATYRADAPPGFEAVLGMCLEKDRIRRLPSVAALAAALVPYGPPRAALYAERAALALGEQVMISRPTAELPPAATAAQTDAPAAGTAAEPAMTRAPAASSPAVTASPTVSSAQPAAPHAPRRAGIIAAAIGGLALLATAGLAAVGFGLRGEPRPGAGAVTSATSATAPPPVVSATAPATDAGAAVEPAVPAAVASATAGPSATAPPKGALPRKGPAQAPPATKGKRNIYDQ